MTFTKWIKYCLLTISLFAFAAMAETKTVIDANGVETLLMPSIPDTIRVPQERASYLVVHFWDNMDFTDSAKAVDKNFITQNLVNYLSVMPIASQEAREEAIDQLYKSAAVNSDALVLIDETIEKYLYEPQSPMFSESLFCDFIDGKLRGEMFSAASRSRASLIKQRLLRNAAGTLVADFPFITRDGNETTLYEALSSGNACCGYSAEQTLTLLLFYDPDCDDCKTAKATLAGDPQFKSLRIIAVYDGDDDDLYESTKSEMPQQWTVGKTVESVEESEIFDFLAMPTIFLLDNERNVILKNASLEEVAQRLGKSY